MPSDVHFTQLQSNLSEIYAALHEPSPTGNLRLYSTSNRYLYFQKGVLAQIRKIYDRVKAIFAQIFRMFDSMQYGILPSFHTPSSEEVSKSTLTECFNHAVHTVYVDRQRRIWKQIDTMNKIWENNRNPPNFIEQRERYKNYLGKELAESVGRGYIPEILEEFDVRDISPFTEKEEGDHRCRVADFHQATYVFWSLFMSSKKEDIGLRQTVRKWLEDSSTLTDRPLFKALKQEGRWVEMESILQQSIPVALIAKLGNPESLTVDEKYRLKLWIQALNQKQANISPKMFSHVIKEIIRIIQVQGSSTLTLDDFLLWLDQQGCELIHQEDEAQMDWREKLTSGETIDCNGTSLVLGKEMGFDPDKMIDDRFKVFEIENSPHCIVKIPHNRFILRIENRKALDKENHCGLPLVETMRGLTRDDDEKSNVSGLDGQGRCVVQEKLFSPFTAHVWTSDKFTLTSEDEKPASVFANFIFCISQWGVTPQDLSLEHLMWDNHGVLKTTRLLKKGPPNYNMWEEYCISAAKENPYVLSFLMRVSKLSEYPVAVYYREAVEYALTKGKTDLIGRSLPSGHRAEVYNDQVKELCGQALTIRQRCIQIAKTLRHGGKYSKDDQQLEADVSETLLRLYHASPISSRFPADFEKQFKANFPKILKPVALSEDIQDYYQEQHQLLRDRNQAVRRR